MSLELPNWYFDHVALIFGAALVCLHFLAPVRAPTATVCEEPDESGASLVIAENLDVHPDPAVIAAAPFDSRTEVQQRERD